MQRWLDLLMGLIKLGFFLITRPWNRFCEKHCGICFVVETLLLAFLFLFMILAIVYHHELSGTGVNFWWVNYQMSR